MELIKYDPFFFSDVLAAFLRSDCQESRTKEITIEDFKPKTVEAFLKFMYIEAVQTVDIDICLLQMSDKVRIFWEDNNFFKKSHTSNLRNFKYSKKAKKFWKNLSILWHLLRIVK